MSITFTYTKITGQYYLDYTDEWEEYGVDFDYEVSEDKLLDAVVDLLKDEYLKNMKREEIETFIKDFDLLESLVESYIYELREMFEQEAFESYE